MKININLRGGFTIVEIIVVVAILGILSSICVFSFGSWKSDLAKLTIQSDLSGVVSAMEHARTFSNGYPASIPSTFHASKNISFNIVRIEAKSYCIEATNSELPDLLYHIDSSAGTKVQSGACDGLTSVPSGLMATPVSTNEIDLVWKAVAGATGYTIASSTNAAFAGHSDIFIDSGSTESSSQTGLNSLTKYYYKIAATINGKDSDWSDVVSASTGEVINVPVQTTPTVIADLTYSTFSWTEVSCGVGAQTVYRYTYNISNGYSSGRIETLGTTLKFTTSIGGLDYSVNIQSKCNNSQLSNPWSEAVETTYHRARKWHQIASGPSFTCGVSELERKAYCWGSNVYGQLGNNSTINSSVPVEVVSDEVLAGKTIKLIATGNYNACVIASDDKVYCWGRNEYGILGDNTQIQRLTPVAVYTNGVLNGKTIKSLAVGSYHSCVIASDDLPYCWGQDANYGALGYGSIVYSVVPVAVITSGALSGKTVTKITTGYYNTCVIASDNLEYCWGRNNKGQVGVNSTTDVKSPALITMTGVLSGLTIKAISFGNYHSCAIASNDKAYCWGWNSGRLGNSLSVNSSVPVEVSTSGPLSGKTFKSISASYYHTCAVASDDNIYCWGPNQSGQLGDNSVNTALSPVATVMTGALSGKTPVTSLSAGVDATTCVVGSDNFGYCWGANGSGQIGNNTTTNSLVPVLIY